MPPPKPYLLQVAERINNATGKEYLGRICVFGLALESAWHLVVERRFLGTPEAAVRKAASRAVVRWPAAFVVTAGLISWAKWRVEKAEDEGRKG